MVKIGFYGVGAISCMVIKRMLEREDVQIVAAVDRDPAKLGRDLSELINSNKSLGVRVSEDSKVLGEVKPDVTVHAATSRLEEAYVHILECVEAGSNVVSTCEELYYPWIKNREIGRKLDLAAKRRGVSVLATGINPGFMMDALPVILSAPCVSVKRIKVKRVVDASRRRFAFQAKIGIGLAPEEFNVKIRRGEITGHIGLDASLAAAAHALGIELDQIRVPLPEPITAEKDLELEGGTVEEGMVSGLKHVAVGIKGGEEVIRLEFWAYVNPPEEFDSIRIEGEPGVNQKIIGGVHGDLGTVGMIVNSVPQAINAPPGLHSTCGLIHIHALPNRIDRYLTGSVKRSSP